MSIKTVTSGLFAIKPSVRVEGDTLIARSGLIASALLLFFYGKKVIVDRTAREVVLETRIFWFVVLVRKVGFDRIGGIGYRVRTMTSRWSLWSGPTDELEFLSVSLELLEPRETWLLFRFMGQGAVETGLSGVLMGGDDLIDFRGDQATAAVAYVRALETFTGKKMVVMN